MNQIHNESPLQNKLQSPTQVPKQRGVTVWFTGLSGAGKTTICRGVAKILRERGYKVEVLDGDEIRQNISRGLGFSKEDRDNNIRNIGYVAQLLTRNDVIVLVAAISPYRALRQEVASNIKDFIEVYVNAPLEVCEKRDTKGLYRRAQLGNLKSLTGFDAPYERPQTPQIECKTYKETIQDSITKVLYKLQEKKFVSI